MQFKNLVVVYMLFFVELSKQQEWETSEITGYHFHTYYYQNNAQNAQEAMRFRETIQELSDTFLVGCRLNRMNVSPIGPHIIGSFETCCCSYALDRAQSFFMQNHGNLSILLHPLTRYEILDHTTRAMWLGKDMPLDISTLREDIGSRYHDEVKCLPINLNVGGGVNFIMPNSILFVMVFYFVIYHKLF